MHFFNLFIFCIILYPWKHKNTWKMWTFLGVATFTYVYKKCDELLSAPRLEVLLTVLGCCTIGLVLSLLRCRGRIGSQKQGSPGIISRMLNLNGPKDLGKDGVNGVRQVGGDTV